jgi:Ran GTPase-activating protein (RanGAP) involved in mRNA processing and transport
VPIGVVHRLTDLDLRDNEIGNRGAVCLSAWGGGELQTLYLVNNGIGYDGGTGLARTPNLPKLSRLYLNHNPVGDLTAHAFAASQYRDALRELDLRSCGITDEGAMALAGSPLVRQLQMLWLTDNPIRRRDTWRVLRERYGDRLIGKGPDTGG